MGMMNDRNKSRAEYNNNIEYNNNNNNKRAATPTGCGGAYITNQSLFYFTLLSKFILAF